MTPDQVKTNLANFQANNGGSLSTKPKIGGALVNGGMYNPDGSFTQSQYVRPDSYGGGAITGAGVISQNGTTPITSSSLNPVAPMKVPEIRPTTAADSLTGTAQALAEQNKQALAKAEANKVSSTNDIKSIQDQILGVQSGRADAETAAGLDAKKERIAMLNNQIESDQRAQFNEINAVKARGDISQEAQSKLVQDVNAKHATYQADLGLSLSVANRDYATAQSIVDRKVELQLEPLQTKYEFAKTFYEDNKDTFTKAEDRQYKALETQAQREYTQAKDFEDKKGTYGLQALKDGNQALYSAINTATNNDELASAIVSNANSGIITTGTAPEIQKALSVILGSGKFTKDQTAQVTRAINNGEDPFTVIKNQAKNIMGQTLATTLDKYETSKAQIQSIDSLLKDYYKEGGKTDIFSGNYQTTLNKLGTLSDPKLVEIGVGIASALQNYRNAVSGTAYSVQEGVDIASIFPGINKSQGLNKAIIDGRIKSFDSQIDSAYTNTLGSSYKELKESEKKFNEALQPEKTAQDKLTNYKTSNPSEVGKINASIAGLEATIGRQITAEEFFQAFPEYNK